MAPTGSKNTISSAHLSTLAESGIAQEIAERLGWYSAGPVELIKIQKRKDIRCGGIVMPFGDGFCRVRLDEPLNGAKYIQEAGTAMRLYLPNLPALTEVLPNGMDRPIYVTEGEKKAVCACLHGLPCIGIGGVWSWKDADGMLPDWKRVGIAGRRFVLVGDSDLAGRPKESNANDGLPKLADALLERGAEEARVVVLPGPSYGDPGGKVGLDDYLVGLGHSVEEFLALVEKAAPWTPKTPEAARAWATPKIDGAANAIRGGADPAKELEKILPVLGTLWAADESAAKMAAVQLAQADRNGRGTLTKAFITGMAKQTAAQQREHPKIFESMTVGQAWADALMEHHSLQLPSGFYSLNGEVWTNTAEGPAPASTGPVYVSRLLADLDTGIYRREIRFRARKEWRKIAPRISQVEDAKELRQFLDTGLPSDHRMIHTTMHYLTAMATNALPLAHTTSIVGQRKSEDHNFIVLPSGAWGVEGPLAQAPVEYAADSTPANLDRISPLPDGSRAEASNVLKLLLHCADPAVTWVMAGWYAAALLAPSMRRAWGEFPLLNVYGGKGSGKSSLLQAFSLTFAANADLGSAKRPPFSLIKEMSSTNMFPLILDEYRIYEINQKDLGNLHHLLRQALKGGRESRGRPSLTTQDYFLIAPIVLSGESTLEDGAIRDRAIMVPVSAASVVGYPEAKNAYANLLALGEDCLRRTAGWLWSEALKTEVSREELWTRDAELREMHPTLSERNRHGLTIALHGAAWLAELLGLGNVPEKSVCDRAAAPAREEEGPLAGFIRYLEIQAATPLDKRETAMQLVGDNLFIHQAQAVAGFAEAARRRGEPWLGRDSLLRELVEHSAKTGAWHRLNGQPAKCIVLDAPMLEDKYGIPTGAWSSDQVF